jgi:pimeloyl-ACP methyl ester carboxylesterase
MRCRVGGASAALAALAALVLLGGTAPLAAQAGAEPDRRPGSQEPIEVSWPTSDERTVHATWYGSVGPPRGIIMALHQAGASGRGEYAPIIPRLAEAGWDVVAVDLREGGSRFGGVNRTAPPEGGDGDYCAATPDILGGISYVRGVRADIPLVLVGSSYSGALALRAGAFHNNDVSAVVAFSPATGEAVAACRGEDVTGRMLAPILALRPASEMKGGEARRQFETFEAQGHQTFVASPGTHGASMLVAERVGGDVEDTWVVLEEFLVKIGR